MEIRSQRGFPQRLGKHKTLSTVPTRPDGGSIIGFTFFQRQRSTLHAAPDGIRTAKETQHQPNSTAEKGDIFNEVRHLVLFSLTFVSTSDISGSIHTIFGYQGIVALQDLGTPIRV